MKRLVFVVIALCALSLSLMAIPARPDAKTILIQPDGSTITAHLHGDDFYHYYTSADGKLLERADDSFYRATEMPSAEEMCARAARSPRRITQQQNSLTRNLAPRGLFILVNFSDLAFKTDIAEIDSMINGLNYSRNYSFTYGEKTYSVKSSGSARQYFHDCSFGQYNPVFDVIGPVTLSKGYAYYGGNNPETNFDSHATDMIKEACKLVDNEVDFTQYDNDNDGKVDFVYVMYAGYSEAEGAGEDYVWPHNYHLSYANVKCTVDGVRVDNYACSNELKGSLWYGVSRDGIGSFCHEFSHVLGLPDHYATNNISVKQTGDWDIMCSGSYNNNSNTPAGYTAQERFFMGWCKPVVLNEPVTIDSMKPLVTSGEMYLISETGEHNLKGNDPSPTQFFMLENRKKVSWDAFVPGEGLLITKINYSYSKWISNTVNNTASARCYEIIEADGKEPSMLETGGDGKQGDVFPYEDVDSYLPYEDSPITAIRVNDDGTIHFNFKGGDDHVSELTKEKAAELYGEEYSEIVGVYDAAGRKVHDEGVLNDLPSGMYVVMVSNGKKMKGVKIYVK